MNILIINYEFPPVGGGGGIATYYIARELSRAGLNVSVLTSQFRGQRRCEALEGIHVYRVPVLRKRRDYCSVLEMASFVLMSCPVLVYLLLKHHYDLLHIFFGVPSGPLGYLAKTLFGIPYLIRMGGGDVPGFRPFQYKHLYTILTPFLKVLWKNAAFLVANSNGLREMALRMFPDIDIEVIPNGVDISRFSSPLRKIPDEPVRILFVSRLIRRKGLQFLIEAVPLIRRQTAVPFEIHIVGDGPDRPLFEEQIAARGLRAFFRFHGYVEHGKLPEYYLDSDIFVLPSLAEGMPNVVLEALGSGLPVVATRVPGSEDLVQSGQNGFLVEARDPKALAEAVSALLDSPRLRERMGQRSLEYGKQYTWASIAEQYLSLYLHMARSGRQSLHKGM